MGTAPTAQRRREGTKTARNGCSNLRYHPGIFLENKLKSQKRYSLYTLLGGDTPTRGLSNTRNFYAVDRAVCNHFPLVALYDGIQGLFFSKQH